MTTVETSFGKITIAEYVPTVENADVLPLIDALREADGEELGKNVAYTSYPTEEEAKKYRTKIQRAARSTGEVTAWTTIDEDKENGTFVLTTRLRPRIERATPAPKVAEEDLSPTEKASKVDKK